MDPHLTELQDHYGSAYRLSHPEPDTWLAMGSDDHETLKAETRFELSTLSDRTMPSDLSRAVRAELDVELAYGLCVPRSPSRALTSKVAIPAVWP